MTRNLKSLAEEEGLYPHLVGKRQKKSAARERRFVITMGDRMHAVCSSVSSFVDSAWSMTFSEESSRVGPFGNVMSTSRVGGVESLLIFERHYETQLLSSKEHRGGGTWGTSFRV